MPAVVKARSEPGLELQEVPVPDVGPNDVRIRVQKASICGTDVHIYNWDAWAQKTIPVPLVIGHEFVGVVDRVGNAVTDFKEGELVTTEGHIVCGHCRNCLAGRRHLCPNTKGIGVNRPGGFAEYVVVPYKNIWRCDPKIPLDVISCSDPLGNAVHTALSFDLVGEDVLITGAGPIGCMAVPIAKMAGARKVVITDVNPYRLDIARKMGATLAVDVRKRETSRCDARTGDEGRIRRRTGNVRQSARLYRHARRDGERRPHRHARDHARQRGDRLEPCRLSRPDDQRNLRPRDV